MKECILKKWYVNIIIFFLFGFVFMFYTILHQDKLLSCSIDNSKIETCKTHLETGFLDSIIPKNDIEKIDTDIVLQNGSKTYNFFIKYAKYIGFGVGFIAMIIIFILYGLKFVVGLGKYKILNVFALIFGYNLVLLLGINFLYREPRFTEIAVASVQFFGHSLTLISFYIILIILILVILNSIINLILNKRKNEKSN